MRHLMSHNGHLKTAIFLRGGRLAAASSAHASRPSRVRPLARGAGARRTPPTKPAPTPAGWPPTTTKTSTWSASCCPSACTRISTTSTPIAAGPTIWATKSATARESLRLLAWWRGELDAMYAGAPRIRCSWRCAGTVERHSHSAPAVRRPDSRLRAGSDRHALPRLGRAVRLLPLFRQSRSAAWCCISAATPTPNGSGSPTPPAPPCNWPISGRT